MRVPACFSSQSEQILRSRSTDFGHHLDIKKGEMKMTPGLGLWQLRFRIADYRDLEFILGQKIFKDF